MNNILTISKIENNGVVHFTFNGENIQDTYEVSIIDENTNLTVHKSYIPLKNGVSWWISTGLSNAQRLKNVKLTLQYGEELIEIPFQFDGQNRYLVIDSKQIQLSHSGDDLFPIVCEIFYDKVYERDFVKVSIDDIIVDIGANYGVFSLYSQMFKPKKVYAVEPIKSTFENMKKNLDEYGVVCINKACDRPMRDKPRAGLGLVRHGNLRIACRKFARHGWRFLCERCALGTRLHGPVLGQDLPVISGTPPWPAGQARSSAGCCKAPLRPSGHSCGVVRRGRFSTRFECLRARPEPNRFGRCRAGTALSS